VALQERATVLLPVPVAVRRIFERFDTDKSGDMSARELRNAMKLLGVQCDHLEAAALLQKYDGNANGRLSVHEFNWLVLELVEFQASIPSGGSAAEMLRKWGQAMLHWAMVSGELRRSDGDAIVTRSSDECTDAALGSLVMKSGRHRILMTIVRSHENSGACMQLGLADATCAAFEGATLGFYPYFGHIFTEENAFSGSVWGKRLVESNLQGCVDGAQVELLVDMDKRSVIYTITPAGGKPLPSADAGVTLPAAVRPWIKLGHLGDSVDLRELNV